MSDRRRPGACELIAATVDPGTGISWDVAVDLSGLSDEYLADLAKARAGAGTDEAILKGQARVRGTMSPSS
jgi:hypothetical protein